MADADKTLLELKLAGLESYIETLELIIKHLRGALNEAPIPERESIYKGEEWDERYIDWWDKYEDDRINGEK
jgi:hypothetical protein